MHWGAVMKTPKRPRRAALALAVGGMFAAFTSTSAAQQQRVGVDVEATPYGGTTSGHLPARGGCAFAPTVGTTFAGVGGRVRYRQHADDDRTRGLSVTAQGAVEYQAHTLRAPGSDMQRAVPDDGVAGAAGVSVGYDWRYLGFRAGVIGRQVVSDPTVPCDANSADAACLARATYPNTHLSVFPDVTVRAGPSDGFHGELGAGAYTPAMLLRPGAHVGVGYSTRRGHDVTARCGFQSTVGDEFPFRCDLSGSLPLNERVTVGAGGAVVNTEDRVNFDARASVTVHLGD